MPGAAVLATMVMTSLTRVGATLTRVESALTMVMASVTRVGTTFTMVETALTMVGTAITMVKSAFTMVTGCSHQLWKGSVRNSDG